MGRIIEHPDLSLTVQTGLVQGQYSEGALMLKSVRDQFLREYHHHKPIIIRKFWIKSQLEAS